MSCMTSEQDLNERRAYARKHGWDHLPTVEHVDVECPYCGVELAFEYDYEGNDDTEDECPACGKTFNLYIEWEPVYNLSEKKGAE